MSSAANNCLTLLTNLSIEAKSMDPDQTATIGAVIYGYKLFVIEASQTFQQTRKADDFVAIGALRVKRLATLITKLNEGFFLY